MRGWRKSRRFHEGYGVQYSVGNRDLTQISATTTTVIGAYVTDIELVANATTTCDTFAVGPLMFSMTVIQEKMSFSLDLLRKV